MGNKLGAADSELTTVKQHVNIVHAILIEMCNKMEIALPDHLRNLPQPPVAAAVAAADPMQAAMAAARAAVAGVQGGDKA